MACRHIVTTIETDKILIMVCNLCRPLENDSIISKRTGLWNLEIPSMITMAKHTEAKGRIRHVHLKPCQDDYLYKLFVRREIYFPSEELINHSDPWDLSSFLCILLISIRNFNGSNPDWSLALASSDLAVRPGYMNCWFPEFRRTFNFRIGSELCF